MSAPSTETKTCKYEDHDGPNPLPLSEFTIQKRRKDGTPVYKSYCRACVTKHTRKRRSDPNKRTVINRRRRALRRERRMEELRQQREIEKGQRGPGDPLVELAPFSAWLREQIQENSLAGMANELRMDHSWVARLSEGRLWDKLTDTWTLQQRIHLSIVDEALTRMHTTYFDVYGDWPPDE